MLQPIQSKIIGVQHITESVFVLKLEKNNYRFQAGQYLTLLVPGFEKAKEYSIYSGENDECIELLIKEIGGGEMSNSLRHLKAGTKVEIGGPFGIMVLDRQALIDEKPIVFIATGTGIAPFHSMIKTNPSMNYSLFHGVRYAAENYGSLHFDRLRYTLCTSRDEEGSFKGRVSDYFRETSIDAHSLFYLCGSSEMVNEMMQLLREKGILRDNIRTEIFY
jgi:ferredoxin/flavodoxin---NADP+ reductase